MTLVYRLLSVYINIIGFFLAMSLLFIIPFALTVPPLWLPTFVIVAVLLYTWFSGRFKQKVLQRREVVSYRLRDWVRVNGIVSIIFCIMDIPPIFSLMRNPEPFLKAMMEAWQQMGREVKGLISNQQLYTVGIIMLLYLIALLVHVLWTFALMKKNQEFFQ